MLRGTPMGLSHRSPPGARGSKRPKDGSGAPLAPRVSPAAVRIPDPRQLSFDIAFPARHPQIFVHEGARQALERKLSQAFGRPVLLAVTDNRRHIVSCSRTDAVVVARIHHMFLDAPPSVQDRLIDYVLHHDREASLVIGRYIEENGFRIRAQRPLSTRIRTQGDHHDVWALFQKLNDRYFGGTVDALITWGRAVRRRSSGSRRAIKLGTYSATERLIRIHPALDKAWVPRYFLLFIIYHEMLHHVMPATVVQGRRNLHPPAFQAKERMFRDFERAIAWERAHLSRLLRS